MRRVSLTVVKERADIEVNPDADSFHLVPDLELGEELIIRGVPSLRILNREQGSEVPPAWIRPLLDDLVAGLCPLADPLVQVEDVAETELLELFDGATAPSAGSSMDQVALGLVELGDLGTKIVGPKVDVQRSLDVSALEFGWGPDVENDRRVVAGEEFRGVDGRDIFKNSGGRLRRWGGTFRTLCRGIGFGATGEQEEN